MKSSETVVLVDWEGFSSEGWGVGGSGLSEEVGFG